MKKFIFTIILSVFMISCSSFSKKGKEVNYAKKNLESGNYYEAIINYSNALIIDYDYKPAIKGLNAIYKIGIDTQLNKINYLKETNSEEYPYEVEKMYLIYKNIARLRNESFSLLDFKLDFEELKFWQLESSKEFYNSAKLIKNPKTTFDFKKISKLYKKSYLYNPNYLDNFEQYNKNKVLAMQNILYFDMEYENNYINIGKILNNNILDELKKNLNISEYTSFTNGKFNNFDKKTIISQQEKNLKEFNYFLDLNISSVNIYPTTVKTKYQNKIWFEIINEKKEKTYSYDLPKLLDPKSIYLKREYTEISKYKEKNIKLVITYNLIDLKTKKSIKSNSIFDEVKDYNNSTKYIGEIYPNLYNQEEKDLKSDIEILELISKNISKKIEMDLKDILE